MKSILVFCGSKTGTHSSYAETAFLVGKLMAKKQVRMVYGGGGVGLMGVAARAALEYAGEVVGIIPDFLQHIEGINMKIAELHIVDSMHARKQKMAELSDAVLVLPGGYGTLDELFEMLTLIQLQQGKWPVGVLNVNGYYDHLIGHISTMREEGFLSEESRSLLKVSDNVEELIDYLLAQPTFPKEHLERL